MYFIFGMAICIVVYLIISFIFGEVGGLIFLLALAGIIGHLFGEIQRLKKRITNIEKLNGIDETKDYNMNNEEIEKELEQYIDLNDDQNPPKA